MAYKDAEKRNEYNNNFIKENYDRVNLTLPKGQKDVLKELLKKRGKTVNGFLQEVVEQEIKRMQREEGAVDFHILGAQEPVDQ